MDNRKTVVAALVLGFGVLAAIPAQAQTQMDESCVRAVENEVRERYPQALRVEVAALDGLELSDLETGFSGAGHFEDEGGDRMTFSFDCISSARTGQAYGVTLSGATPQPRSSAARQARRGPLSALIAAIANRGRQGSRDVSANEAPVAAGKAAAIAVQPLEPVEAAPSIETASGVEVASALEAGTPIEVASRLETVSPLETSSRFEAAPPVAAASSRTLDGSVVAPYLGDLGCADLTATSAECSGEAAATPASGEALSAPRSTLPLADAALSRIAQDLPTGEVALLRFAAHATTAASMCPNIELNNQAVVGTLSNVVYATALDLTPQQAASRRDAALVAYGVLTGLMLQEAAANHAAFCADAAGNAGEAESWSFIRVTDGR